MPPIRYAISTIVASTAAPWAKLTQLTLDVLVPPTKIATIDVAKADGSFKVIDENSFVGFGGHTLSDSSGVITPEETLMFDIEPSTPLKVVDFVELYFRPGGDYALPTVDGISIKLYQGTTLVSTTKAFAKTIKAERITYGFALDNTNYCNRVQVVVNKLDKPNQTFKLLSTFIGATAENYFQEIVTILPELIIVTDVSDSIDQITEIVDVPLVLVVDVWVEKSFDDYIDIVTTVQSELGLHDLVDVATDLDIQTYVEFQDVDTLAAELVATSEIEVLSPIDLYLGETCASQIELTNNGTYAVEFTIHTVVSVIKEVFSNCPLELDLNSFIEIQTTITVMSGPFLDTEVSSVYSQLRAPARQVFCKVRVRYTMNTLDESFSITSNIPTLYPSDILTLLNGVREPKYKYLFLNEANADGTYHLMQPASIDNPVVFNVMSNALGVLTTPLVVTINFSVRPVNDLVLCGLSNMEEYPVNFVVKCFKAGVVQSIVTITDNINPLWAYTANLPAVDKIEYTITKTSKPNTMIKLMELYGATIEEYEGDKLMYTDLLEELEPQSSGVSLGTMSSNQLSLGVYNEEGRFNFNNSNSVIKNLLKSNREITMWYGVLLGQSIAWEPMGTYWSGPWKSTYNSLETTTVAYDLLKGLSRAVTLSTRVNITMYDWFVLILNNAGISHTQYSIDDYYKGFIIPYAFTGNITHAQALKDMTAMCFCNIYCDRDRGIIIRPKNKSIPMDEKTLDKSCNFDYDVDNEDSVIINRAIVKTSPFVVLTGQELLSSAETYMILPGTTETIQFKFSKAPYLQNFNAVIHQATGLTVYLVAVYSWGCEYKVVNSTGSLCVFGNVQFTGDILVASSAPSFYFKQDLASITEFGVQKWEYAHPLIQTQALAQVLLNDVINEYSQPTKKVTIVTRGDYTIRLGEELYVEDFNDFSQLAKYKQYRAQHKWNGAYESTLDIIYEGDD